MNNMNKELSDKEIIDIIGSDNDVLIELFGRSYKRPRNIDPVKKWKELKEKNPAIDLLRDEFDLDL